MSKRRKRRIIVKAVILVVLLVMLGVCVAFLVDALKEMRGSAGENQGNTHTTPTVTPEPSYFEENTDTEEARREATMAQAAILAQAYDYDGAKDLLMTIEGAASDTEIQTKIAEYQTMKDSCVPVTISDVTHVLFLSLVVDPELGFAGDDSASVGFKQKMTTLDEFTNIIQAMYDNGYVIVSARDLVVETTDENGVKHFTKNGNLLLPEGKKAYVLSVDDLNYYHSYEGKGVASKMVLDENGQPTCEYVQADGTVVTGAYDCIPLLDQFIKDHPDASYQGAKGIIGVTGYDGVLGYRTDIAYKTGENLGARQQAWLNAHPDFNWEAECEAAKEVAEAIKANGWEFANHTWGHIAVGSASLDKLKTDIEKWETYVKPLVGQTDMIAFAHGEDIGHWREYSADNEKFQYLKSLGYNFFFNVDSSQNYLQIRDNYLRMGRRSLDGYRLWNDAHGNTNVTSDLFDASQVLDPKRTGISAS